MNLLSHCIFIGISKFIRSFVVLFPSYLELISSYLHIRKKITDKGSSEIVYFLSAIYEIKSVLWNIYQVIFLNLIFMPEPLSFNFPFGDTGVNFKSEFLCFIADSYSTAKTRKFLYEQFFTTRHRWLKKKEFEFSVEMTISSCISSINHSNETLVVNCTTISWNNGKSSGHKENRLDGDFF